MSSLYVFFLLLGVELVQGQNENSNKNYNSNCPDMAQSLADSCTINDDCTKITCTIASQGNKVLSWTIKINKCEDPVTVDVSIDAIGIHWSKTFTSDERVGVPGLSIDFPLIGSAGVFVKVSLPDSGSNLHLKIEMLFAIGSIEVGKSTTLVDSKLPINTYECGIVRFWTELDMPLKILLVIGAVIFVIILPCICCYCCCCRKKTPGTVIVSQPPAAAVLATNNTIVPMQPFVRDPLPLTVMHHGH